jgi:hypothetical protein
MTIRSVTGTVPWCHGFVRTNWLYNLSLPERVPIGVLLPP